MSLKKKKINIMMTKEELIKAAKQLEEIRSLQRLKYNKKKEQENLLNKKIEEKNLDDVIVKEYQENLDKKSEEKNNGIKDSYMDCLCPENEIPIIHSEILNESFIIILSIFEDQPNDFVKNSIINQFYNKVNITNVDELFTFYISIMFDL